MQLPKYILAILFISGSVHAQNNISSPKFNGTATGELTWTGTNAFTGITTITSGTLAGTTVNTGTISGGSFIGDGSGLTGMTKSQVGLGNVDNTSDAAKPVSTAGQAALDLKQTLSGTLAIGGFSAITGTLSGTNVATSGTATAGVNTQATDAEVQTGTGSKSVVVSALTAWWTWVKTQAQTFAGNLTLEGTANTAPNQTAASGSSVMTRSLVDIRANDIMIAGPRRLWLTSFSGWTTDVSGGAVSQGTDLRSATTATQWSYGVARNPAIAKTFIGSGGVLNFSASKLFGVAYYSSGADYRNGTDQIFFGGSSVFTGYAASAVVNPATRGFGWRIKDETIYATQVTNGGTYSEPGNTAVILSAVSTTRQDIWLVITSDGAGNIVWYVNGSSIATSSTGPTGATNINEGYINFSSVMDAAGSPAANLNSISAILIDSE